MSSQRFRGLLSVVGVTAVLVGAALSTSSGAGATSPTLPVAAVQSNQAFPHTVGTTPIVSAEASNGDVAIAEPHAHGADSIEIAKPGHAPAAFISVPAGTVALAFDKTDLFVAGLHAMSAINRKTKAVEHTWQVKVVAGDGDTITVGDGRVWVLGSTGHGRKVFEINPATHVITTRANATKVPTIAAGVHGVYFVTSGGETLVRISASGHRKTAPTHQKANLTLSGPGAVHVIVVDHAHLLVAHDAGQGLDSAILRYSVTTLAKQSLVGTNVALTHITPTIDGDLVLLTGSGQGGCSDNTTCSARISTVTAKTSHRLRLPKGLVLSGVLGPEPAVVIAEHGHAHLVRFVD